MKYELKKFQQTAADALLKEMNEVSDSYRRHGSVSSISLSAPTGAGKTVICAAVLEGLFFGTEKTVGNNKACILWLTDSPSLNEQTIKRFAASSDMLDSGDMMETIDQNFATSHDKLAKRKIYFLNRQLLGTGKILSKSDEGKRTFWDVLANTINDPDTDFFLFIDEAHRGLGKTGDDAGTSELANKTIYSQIIDGQPGFNSPVPCVIGISATPKRFDDAMAARTSRDRKAPVIVPVEDVRNSGLIKESVELHTPYEKSDILHQDLISATKRLAERSAEWKNWCQKHKMDVVVPLMVVQVEDNISNETITKICADIMSAYPSLSRNESFANVFGEHKDISTNYFTVPYVKPEEVETKNEIRILFAKDAVSTGWDCPRAEVLYSRRKRNDPTYIAQMIGRMIRTPLAMNILDGDEDLNTVTCYLPEYDSRTVDEVTQKLVDETAGKVTNVKKNPVKVKLFIYNAENISKELDSRKKTESSNSDDISDGIDKPKPSTSSGLTTKAVQKTDTSLEKLDTESSITEKEGESSENLVNSSVKTSGSATAISTEAGVKQLYDLFGKQEYAGSEEVYNDRSDEELEEVLRRLPDRVEGPEVIQSFEGIVSRHCNTKGSDNEINDLKTIADIIADELMPEKDFMDNLVADFGAALDYNINTNSMEFKKAVNDVGHTTMTVIRVDPLTGKQIAEKDHEFEENDFLYITDRYDDAIREFGFSDAITAYVQKYINEHHDDPDAERDVLTRVCAAASVFKIMQGMKDWASQKTKELIDKYDSVARTSLSDVINKDKWNSIVSQTKSYFENNLKVMSCRKSQDKTLTKYPKHIFCDEDGWAYFTLNKDEDEVVNTELSKPQTVAWYRNPQGNINAALSITYEVDGEQSNFYPDFIFFMKSSDGRITRSIADPHGDWLGDSTPRLRGYVSYLRDHKDMFASVMAITAIEDTGKEKAFKYLEMTDEQTQNAILNFNGDTARALFEGEFGRNYHIQK